MLVFKECFKSTKSPKVVFFVMLSAISVALEMEKERQTFNAGLRSQ